MASAQKAADTDCYVSDRVFDGVRAKDASSAARHIARVRRLLGRADASGTPARPIPAPTDAQTDPATGHDAIAPETARVGR